jgi:hypothetical protein
MSESSGIGPLKSTAMTEEEAIRQNVLAAISRFSGLSNVGTQFGYNRESVAWVEGFIEQQRGEATSHHMKSPIWFNSSALTLESA